MPCVHTETVQGLYGEVIHKIKNECNEKFPRLKRAKVRQLNK